VTPEDDEADSVLRALAAAPPVKPPERVVTAMVVKLAHVAPLPDQIGKVRTLVEAHGGTLATRDDGLLAATWLDALTAARVALELRDALPATRIALASGKAGPAAAGRAVDHALALLAMDSDRICVDDETAKLIEPKFELEHTDKSGIVLVERLATGTPALVDRVIGNYKIVCLLGTGGMGVVYLAEHITLGRKAVIKFVQEQLHADGEYAMRFFTEAKTAASIRHPGIVDVFDYGKDERGRGYIVMEYLDGESLRTRLRRAALPADLAVPLAGQVANAVAAAHAAKIIHRDLKPDNLFLVPDPEAPQRVRVKVLDFGLAKMTADAAPSVTQSGNFVGTPQYMSPEQCRSKADIDHRTDVYSLGCILFEMVTGRPPFTDRTIGDLIIAHNTLPPPNPSEIEPTVSPALARAILRALAKHPDDRFATMAEFANVLAQIADGSVGTNDTVPARPAKISAPPPITDAATSVTPVGKQRINQRRSLALVGVAAVLVAAGVVGFLVTRDDAPRPRVLAPASGNNSIAVIDLENRGKRPDAAWLSTALGELIASDLGTVAELQTIPAADVARMQAELGIGDIADWSADRLGSVRAALGAEYVVAGSYVVKPGGEVEVDVKLYATSDGRVLISKKELGFESDVAELGARLTKVVKSGLGIKLDETVTLPPVLPSEPTAAKLYAEGLDKLRHFELIEARDLLSKAGLTAPSDPLVHSALATVWRELGYDEQARKAAKLAHDFASGLPTENRKLIDAQYREATAQWDAAIKLYRELLDASPRRIDYGLALAAVQTHSGDVKSAYATLNQLRKLPHPLGNDPRIDLAEAIAAEEADDIERMRERSEKAALVAGKRSAHLLRAKALLRQGWALWTLGRDEEAAPIYEEAKQLFTRLGDRSGLARTLNNIALAHHRQHRSSEATKTFADALALAETIGDTRTQAMVLNNWGYVLADGGDLTRALELMNRKLQLGGERGDAPSSQAAAHVNLSELLRWRGDLNGAEQHCQSAEDLLRGTDARRFAAYAALHCGEAMRARDDLDGAKKRFAQAIGWASDVMTPAESAEMRIAMARLELETGHVAEAETRVRAAIHDLRAAKEGSQQVCAIAVLAQALLAKNDVAGAVEEIAVTKSLPAEGVSFACRLEAEAVAAHATWRQDPTALPQVQAALENARQRAAAATNVQLEDSIRLVQGQVAGPAGRNALRMLARDANALGFKLLARKAKAAAK
jgi:serine/threonine protein kinase/tetratricopeptide (TPR) repeat protein/TolB-like protein